VDHFGYAVSWLKIYSNPMKGGKIMAAAKKAVSKKTTKTTTKAKAKAKKK
jgi:hypothetical protein